MERSDDVTAISINDVQHAVISALEEAFPGIPVFGEGTSQASNPPCFVVRLLESSHIQELGRRYRRNYPFVVRCYSANGTDEQLYAMAEQLITALKLITASGTATVGTGMKFEIVDEVLHFYVAYNFLVWEAKPDTPMMGTLDQEGYVRG